MEDKIYEMHARICKTFTSPKRIELLQILRHGEMTVGDLCAKSAMSQSSVSQHLAVMRDCGLLQARRSGTAVYYSIRQPKILKAFDLISDILKSQLEDSGRMSGTF